MENQYSNDQQTSRRLRPAQKLMFFMIGGGIGAAAALLFAPKSGRELRSDVANLIDNGYGKALVAASDIKDRTNEFYEVAKGTSEEVLGVISSGLSVMKDELRNDVAKIGSIVQSSTNRGISQDASPRYSVTESGRNIQEGARR